MLGHSRQRDTLRPISTVHRDGLDNVFRPSLHGADLEKAQSEYGEIKGDSDAQPVHTTPAK